MSHSPASADAQVPRVRPWRIPRPPVKPYRPAALSPQQIADKQNRIRRLVRIERALMLIAKTHCDTQTACRAVGLRDNAAAPEVRRILDERRIPRRHWWGREPQLWKTAEPHPAIVKPRKPGGPIV